MELKNQRIWRPVLGAQAGQGPIRETIRAAGLCGVGPGVRDGDGHRSRDPAVTRDPDHDRSRWSRRRFLQGVVAAGAGLVVSSVAPGVAAADSPHGQLGGGYLQPQPGAPTSSADFGRTSPSCRHLRKLTTPYGPPCSRWGWRAGSWTGTTSWPRDPKP